MTTFEIIISLFALYACGLITVAFLNIGNAMHDIRKYINADDPKAVIKPIIRKIVEAVQPAQTEEVKDSWYDDYNYSPEDKKRMKEAPVKII